MDSEKHSIMVIDDHPIVHDGLETLLAREADLKIISHANSSSAAMRELKKQLPDIAIVDLSLGDSDGTYLVQRIHSKYPKLKILVYTMSEERLFAERTATAGASGYVMKTSPPIVLKKAIRHILSGELHFAPDIIKKIDRKLNGRSSGSHSLIDTLSNREMDIFKLLGEGLGSTEIGKKLRISRNTVDTHRINIKNKLNLANGKALDHYAYETIRRNKKL